jgi:N utilization substance protein B
MARKPITEAQQRIAQRRVARRLAMIGTYQWIMTKNSFHDIYIYFQEDSELAEEFRKSDSSFFHQLMRSAIEDGEKIEPLLVPHLDRGLNQVDPIEYAILRMACAEFLHHPETPYKVVVNEAVNLTKKYGAEQAHKFVNGILDKVASATRQREVAAARP